MNKSRSRYFISVFSKKDILSRNILILLFLTLFFTFYFLFLDTIKCLIITGQQGDILYVQTVRDGDVIKISHINSIYDAKVEEVLSVEGNEFMLKDVNTRSYGVLEYYGITEGLTPRRFSAIIFRNTKDREFSLYINDKKIGKILYTVNTALMIELKCLYFYKFLLIKLKTW